MLARNSGMTCLRKDRLPEEAALRPEKQPGLGKLGSPPGRETQAQKPLGKCLGV